MDKSEETFEIVLYAARGELVEEERPDWVEGPGKVYNCAWEQLYRARQDICDRTGISWEDPALEQIMDAVDALERDISRRIFYAVRNVKNEKL